jgi:hypothetical protein
VNSGGAELLDRLFRGAVGRAPTEDEASRLRRAADDIFPDLPPTLRDALGALAAQTESGAALGDDASWAWLVDFVADAIPGGEITWEGPQRRFALPGLPLLLMIDEGASRAWRVGLPPEPRRLRPDRCRGNVGRLMLAEAPSLERLFEACEVHCVAGCCSTDAFDVSSAHIRWWLDEAGKAAGEAARRELEATLAELEGAREAPIVSYRLNVVWPPGEGERYLRRWHGALVEALG